MATYATDTAKYRWKVKAEKTVLFPETQCEMEVMELSASFIETDLSVINRDAVISMYNKGESATVVFNGVAYTCPVRYVDGFMDTVYGFGNSAMMDYFADAGGQEEDTGEPFAIFTPYDDFWVVYYRHPIASCTFSIYIEGAPTLVSVGQNDNPITTREGGIVNGVFKNARYKLKTPFKLLHDKDWAVEWKNIGGCVNDAAMAKIWDESGLQTSTSSRSIILRETTKSISISRYSQSHIHYGVKLSRYNIDYAAEHIYRLQNKVNEDGTNMVWLYVDGEKIAPCTDMFGGETGTSEWVSGKDFSMGYMGTPRYILNGFIMDDIAVWESGASEVFAEPTYDRTAFLSGLAMGLCGKGNPTFEASDTFTKGYLVGAALRRKRITDIIKGDASGLQYDFDQSTLRLDITDTGLEGDTFTLMGSTLTVTGTTIVPEATYDELEKIGLYNQTDLTVNITAAEMQELYNSDTSATVVFNGATYECKPFHLNGTMDIVWGYGNPVIASYNADAEFAEDTGEPFALCTNGGTDWRLWCNSDIATVTISAYI